jgi:uncharacterized protein (TIGR04255 family)
MKLPSKLQNDIILLTVFEIRFSTTNKFPTEAIFGILYNIIIQQYPNVCLDRLPITDLPESIRNVDLNLKYQPHYQLDIGKDGIRICIGPKVIQFYVQKPYIGWQNWYKFITEMLNKLLMLPELFDNIERTGLQYINFIEDEHLCSVANMTVEIGSHQLSRQPMTIRTEIQNKEYTTVLQLANNAFVDITCQQLRGSVIDLNIIRNFNEPVKDFQKQLDTVLNESHEIEKKLFFDILRPDFLNKLKPNYI